MNLVGKKVELLKDVYPLKAGAKVKIGTLVDYHDGRIKIYADDESGVRYTLRVDKSDLVDIVFKVLV